MNVNIKLDDRLIIWQGETDGLARNAKTPDAGRPGEVMHYYL